MKIGLLKAVLSLMLWAGVAGATSYYWDVNGTTDGSGGPSPTGTWDGVNTYWNTDSAGGAGSLIGNPSTSDDLTLSAGSDATNSYTLTVSGTRNAQSLTFKDGTPTITGGNLAFPATGTITVNSGISGTINSVIPGASAITKAGAGALTLGGANTYSNGTTIVDGTLRLGANNVLADAGTVTLGSATATFDVNGKSDSIGMLVGPSGGTLSLGTGTLTIWQTTNSTFAGVITGAGTLSKYGAGTMTLTAASPATGGFLVGTANNSGAVNLAPTATLACQYVRVFEGALNFGATNQLSPTATLAINHYHYDSASPVSLNGFDQTIGGLTGNADWSSSGVILQNSGTVDCTLTINLASGTKRFGSATGGYGKGMYIRNNGTGKLSLTKTGAGTQIIGDDAPYSTGNDVAMYLQNTGLWTVSGGVLSFRNLQTWSAGTVLMNGGQMELYSVTNNTWAATLPITGSSGSITVTGGGQVTLSGTNTFSCPIIVGQGTLSLGTAGWLNGTSGLTVSNASALVGSGTLTGSSTFLAGTALRPGGASAYGTLNFGSSLTMTAGSTNFFDLSSSTAIGGGTNDLVTVAGDLAGNGSLILVNPVTPLTNGTYRLFTYTGTLTSGFALFVPTSGTFTLDTNTVGQVNLVSAPVPNALVWRAYSNSIWDVATTVNWTNTATGGNSSFGQNDSVTFDDFCASNVVTLSGSVQPLSILVTNEMQDYTFSGSGSLVGAGGLAKKGAASLSLSNACSFTGATTVNGGTLRLQSLTPYASSVISNNATLTFDPGSGNTTYSGAISGAGTVTKAGTGIFAINGTNSFTGTLDVMAGVLKLNSFNNNSMIFSSTNVLVESGATLLEDFNNNYQTLTLTNVTLNGGTLQAGGGSYGMNQIAINGYLAIGTNGGTYSTATSYGPDGNPVNGVLSGSGPLTVRCDNRGAYNQRSLTLNNSSNTYSGIMTLNNNAASIYTAYGLLQLGTSNAVRYATLNLAQTNAEPNVVAFSSGVTSATVGGLIGGRYNVGIELKNLGGAAVALTVNNSESNQFNGVISGSNGCSLVKANTGVLILAGTNTYTGVTLVQGGTLVLAAPLAGSSVLVVSNSMLSLGAANVVTVTTNLTLSGATLDMGANTNTVSSALTVATGGSTILLSDAALAFPDSSSKTWTGTLNLSGVLKPHTLRFGTDAAGLTLSQKGRIRYRNSGATLDSQGYVVPYGATLIIVQ